jgi:hypothetical protein
MNTQAVYLLPVPFTSPAAMDPRLPIPEDGPVALTAQEVRFFEADEFTADESENIPIVRVVTVQTPPIRFVVINDLDLLVEILQLTPVGIDIHIFVTIGTGKDVLRERGRRYEELGDARLGRGANIFALVAGSL